MSGPPRTCSACQAKPVARNTLRFCFDCLPGGPHVEPPCRRCGTNGSYYSAGLCSSCHQYAPQLPGACVECHAWGATRTNKWLCHACMNWRHKYPTVGACRSCGNHHHVGRGDVCRLCWRQASDAREATKRERPYRPIDVIGSNQHGQQLFLADMGRRRAPRRSRITNPPRSPRRRPPRQLDLFDAPPDTWASRHGLPEPAKTARSNRLEALVREHGARHGWSRNTILRTRLAMRVLAGRQRPPAERFRVSDIMQLAELDLYAAPILAVLGEAGLLEDDRVPAIIEWFERHTADLPPVMRDELSVWFDVLHNGSTTTPRSRPRSPTTIRIRLNWAMPTLQVWAAAGHTSLREISRDDILSALPPSGNPRATLGLALRSIFMTLRGRKLIFTNPIARVPIGAIERREPLPVDVEVLRALLDASDPARAALAALVVFHGLRARELQDLRLIDIRGSRLHLHDRPVPLAPAVRERLGRWLDHRQHRWPSTINPHVFIHHRNAGGVHATGGLWLARTLGMAPSALRTDRILDEAIATGGDVRRLSDLFGITVDTAVRYASILDHPSLTADDIDVGS